MRLSRRPSATDCRVTAAEVLHAVRHEMAVKLSDAVLRRTEAGSAGHPGGAALQTAAALMGDALGWDERRRRSEIAETEKFYEIDES
jgi:glycerol-3-phosphate dehydrogenase